MVDMEPVVKNVRHIIHFEMEDAPKVSNSWGDWELSPYKAEVVDYGTHAFIKAFVTRRGEVTHTTFNLHGHTKYRLCPRWLWQTCVKAGYDGSCDIEDL